MNYRRNIIYLGFMEACKYLSENCLPNNAGSRFWERYFVDKVKFKYGDIEFTEPYLDDQKVKENKFMFEDKFGKMFGKISAGMCRLSMNGDIAVKTENGYKTYNVKTGRLTNCNRFVFDIGEDFFFVVPTNHVKKGDIILVDGKPRCVVDTEKNKITAINYENSTIDTIIPEHHFLLGNAYMYGKIVSMFGNNVKGSKGMNGVIKYMMMSEMMKGNSGNNMNNMLPFMMMSGGGFENMFDGMFDFDFDDFDDDEEEIEKEGVEE